MAIIRTAPNGRQVEFPDGTSEEIIQQYLALPKYQVQQNQTVQNDVQEDIPTTNKKRSFIADMGTQALGGAFDAVNSGIGLIEKIGDTLGENNSATG